MNEPLARFLITLAGDVPRLDAFHGREDALLTLVQTSGLPTTDQEALLSGDADRIYDALERTPDDARRISGDAVKTPGVKKPPVKKPAVKKPGVKKPAVKTPGVKSTARQTSQGQRSGINAG